jgi:hypothetical protein
MKGLSVIGSLMVCAVSSAQAPPQNADKLQLSRLQSGYLSAKIAFKKSHNAKTKKRLIVVTDQLATATMTSDSLDARSRYPHALALYQQVLVLDPSNSEAKNNAELIDSVYHGMIASARKKLRSDPHDATASAQLARFTRIYREIHRPMP